MIGVPKSTSIEGGWRTAAGCIHECLSQSSGKPTSVIRHRRRLGTKHLITNIWSLKRDTGTLKPVLNDAVPFLRFVLL